MADTYTVADLVAEFLQGCGAQTAFGIVSIHNMPMLDAIGRRNAIRFVPARGEAGAGSMADAYARVVGGLGVLFTSTGPGAANAVGAIVEARFAGSPLLHITGQTSTAHVDRGRGSVHDVPDQLGMLKSISKSAYRVTSAESAFGTLMRAAAEALTAPTGPVSVEVPIDLQRMPVEPPAALDNFKLPVPAPQQADPASLDALADMVAAGTRPALWLGNGAKHAGPAVKRLLDLGFALFTSVNGRGVVPESHPQVLGAFNNSGAVEKFYATVDAFIMAGSRVRGHETRDLMLKLPPKRAQIDVDPGANGRTYSCDLFVCGDSGLALEGLADRLEKRGYNADPAYVEEVKALKKSEHEALKSFLGPYGTFPDQLRAALPADTVWVRDITLNNTTWGNRLFPLDDPKNSVYAVGAAIGMGLSHGIGAAIAAPGRRTVAMCGDGGFFLNIAEILTATQEKADVTFLVMNDKGYGVIKHIQDALQGGRNYYADFQNPALEDVAKLAGMTYAKVSRADELGDVVAKTIKASGPSLIEVDMTAIGPFPSYFAEQVKLGRKA